MIMGNISFPCTAGSNQLILLNALAAIVISDDLGADELNVLGNFIVALGSLLLTKAAELSAEQSNQGNVRQLRELQEQVRRLERTLN